MGSKFWLAPGLVFALSRSPESRWHVDRFMRAVSEFFSLVFELRLRGAVKRPGFAGGSTFQIGWSHDEQDDDEQIFT